MQVFVLEDLWNRHAVSQACAQGYHCSLRTPSPLDKGRAQQCSQAQYPSDCLKAALRQPLAGAAVYCRTS